MRAPYPLRERLRALPLLLLAACGSERDDYAVAPSWLINGMAPDEALCATYGVESVRLTIEGSQKDRTLEAACSDRIVLSDGFEYGGFVTTESFDYDKPYRYQVDMLDAQGESIAGYSGSFQAQFGDLTPVELLPLELFWPQGDQASLAGSFTLDGQNLAKDCESAGIAHVEIWVASVTDPELVDAQPVLSSACSAGKLESDGPVLAIGDYQAKYVALDAEDRVVTESEVFSVFVDEPLEVTLPPVRLSAP
jgi:hypothetical protein